MGQAFEELEIPRHSLVVSTKIFWGGKGVNDRGLSRKHIIEGLNESLERLQMDYVDIVFAHRPDSTVPMEEVARAFNYVIENGKAFYWGTSEWSARQIEEAHHVASKLGLIAPIADQCQYNCFHRQRFEVEYKPLYEKYKYGTTIFSPLASGLLTGKYNDGIPEGSRFAHNKDFFKNTIGSLNEQEGMAKINKVKELTELAKKEFDCSPATLALAWAAKNPHTSTVILGASKPAQLAENLKALEVLPKLTDEIYNKINTILNNDPKPEPTIQGR